MYVVELRPLDASAVEAPGEVASDEFGEYDRINGPTAVRCVGGHRWIDQRRSIAQPSASGRPQSRRRSGRAAEALVERFLRTRPFQSLSCASRSPKWDSRYM